MTSHLFSTRTTTATTNIWNLKQIFFLFLYCFLKATTYGLKLSEDDKLQYLPLNGWINEITISLHSLSVVTNRNMYSVYCMVYLICLKLCVCVTSTTESVISSIAVAEQQEVVNHSSDDIKEIKFAVKTLAEQFGKWNFIYMSQMDPKLVSSLTTLTNIDSNIKNLQERAHVWDTFQLHVAAWNDQLSTSDRKLDIISKTQEEILVLEGKVNEISNIEYKIDKVLKKMEAFEDALDKINKKVENSGHVGLFGEFAARGMLSTLKSVEKKMDRILATNSNMNKKEDLTKKNFEESIGKVTIKCNTPPIVEELLHDVASKVDVIFDKISTTDNDNHNEEVENEDYMDDENYLNENLSNMDSESKLNSNGCKRTNQLWKQVKKHLEYMEKNIFAVYNNTVVILENEEGINERYEKCCSPIDRGLVLTTIKNEVKLVQNNIENALDEQTHILENRFSEQETRHKEILKALKDSNNMPIKANYNLSNISREPEVDEYVPDASFNITRYYSDYFFCDDIILGNSSGVYNLANATEASNDYTYYTRYCLIREDGSWTVIQNRNNYRNIENFTVDWYDYKMGFGKLEADFWFGNDFIHRLSYERDLILRIELEDFDGNTAWAEYNQFKVAPENENYRLTIGEYQGNASDSFSSHNNSLFSTFDVKNDDAPECCPCAESYGGGWWYNSCFESNLNGVYYRKPHGKEIYRGIIWQYWLGDYSLKKTRMMVRRKNNIYDETTTVDVHKFLEDP